MRTKFNAKAGPDGGDGGRGGHIILKGNKQLWTLLHLRYHKNILAEHGENGSKNNCSGRQGKDVIIEVPLGTIAIDEETGETEAEILEDGQEVIWLKGGRGGLGNQHFATPTNQVPEYAQPGESGTEAWKMLELKVLADVGLLGMPNAGKSTFIAAVSNARPKIADYPFTTLYPNLGVVRVGPEQSFVVADIPGLIEGASEGAGLGHQFLRHLQRTRLLLHVVDMAPFDDAVDPVAQAKAIVAELKKYDEGLHGKPRWLVLNKLDMVPAKERAVRVKDFVKRFKWKGPVYEISALTREGCDPLVKAIFQHVHAEQLAQNAPAEVDPRFAGEHGQD